MPSHTYGSILASSIQRGPINPPGNYPPGKPPKPVISNEIMGTDLPDVAYASRKKEGKAMATRDQTHRMAEANKAFAHFA